jgi:hypothetical protein
MRNYGIYVQGAIIKKEDFDPVKVILAVSEKICRITLPDNIKTALNLNIFNRDVALEVCELLEVEIEDENELQDYSYISDKIIDEAHLPEWFEESESPLMGTDGISIYAFSEIEGDFCYDDDEHSDEYMADGYMFSLYSPLVWNIRKRNDWKTKAEIVQQISETAKPLLKDGIDWDKRLGSLIGSTFG